MNDDFKLAVVLAGGLGTILVLLAVADRAAKPLTAKVKETPSVWILEGARGKVL